ncbi:cryptochrome/photolyase family protein [Williamsia sterculiae]|uniref:Deoxyribodipyrimidine photolyase-related protein n=1 Tax=Williamsia sterculiae TaxID=1344003 RepID=A0A1N7GZH0_9NOCA|nr:cryptochrome/photolyase family protein [Williamsia sterculiae]SIS17961.1 deoxyribodipyrimidine photolyase-related protein [Williamsia sterculiae]
MSTPAPLWLFADQLGPHIHGADHNVDREVVLVESRSALRRRAGHRQKAHLLLSGMRHLDDELGDRSAYLRADGYREALRELGRPVVVHEPSSRSAHDFVHRLVDEGLVAEVLPNPTFALSRADFEEWAGTNRRFVMENFYRSQRRRFSVLMDGDQPVGGSWNLDADNREPPPKRRRELGVPQPWWPTEDEIDDRVRADLDDLDVDWSGQDGPRLFAVTADEADRALRTFVDQRLDTFGPYEDAVMAADWPMSHSLLSVPLNLSLLDPLVVVHAAEQAYRDGASTLASTEGFIRQILGWREYVWHLYWHFDTDYVDRNELDAHTPLPDWFTQLDADAVTARCLSDALRGVRERGWVHHIPRLMILGSHALQRGYDPAELTRWFTANFVDGYEWVMPVNVVGMSQHADGGLMATKPYTSGGAYLNRMTDHCRDCDFDPKVRVGDDACPFTAGYWAFTHRHRDRLAANQRTRRAVSSMDRLADLEPLLEQEAHRETF